MAEKISQYVFKAVIHDDDLLDFSNSPDAGLTYDASEKVTVLQFVNYLQTKIDTIYIADSTITGDRTLAAGGFFTKFDEGDLIVQAEETVDHAFFVYDNAAVEKARLGYDTILNSAHFELIDSGGTFVKALNSELFVNTDIFYVGTDSVGINITSPLIGLALDIRVPQGGAEPLGLFEDRIGGANTSDSLSVNFYFNDTIGARVIGGQIIAKVDDVTAGAGDVNMSILINDNFKVQSNGRVLITPNVFSPAAVAQLEVRGLAGVSTNTTILAKSHGNTSSQLVYQAQNLAGNNLFYVDATAKFFFNPSGLVTGDAVMRGFTEANVFYFNAGTDNVGFGTSTPNVSAIVEFTSTTRGVRYTPMTVAQAGAITPVEGLVLFVSDTDATFPTIGIYAYESGVWNKL